MWDHTAGVTGQTYLGFEFECEGKLLVIGNKDAPAYTMLYNSLLIYYRALNIRD